MAGSRYERISTTDEADHVQGPDPAISSTYAPHHPIPNSPPPSFRSRASSPTHTGGRRLLQHDDPLHEDAERTMNDAFDSSSGDEDSADEDDDADADAETRDRRRLIPATATSIDSRGNVRTAEPQVERRVTHMPVFAPTARGIFGGGSGNDGVFANLSAKPTRGEHEDEKPPSYEQAAADATPPYWETTILAHPGFSSHEVYVDGLPVGSVFSFLWNGMISMSFQVVGFLLTYLLHTTHAAKNGSRAGLGFTLVQYGFSLRGTELVTTPGDPSDPNADLPSDPNSHDFDTPGSGDGGAGGMGGLAGISTTDWFAYVLMIVGWFILIRAVSDFYQARRHEMLVLQSPERGLGTAVVAEGEGAETAV